MIYPIELPSKNESRKSAIDTRTLFRVSLRRKFPAIFPQGVIFSANQQHETIIYDRVGHFFPISPFFRAHFSPTIPGSTLFFRVDLFAAANRGLVTFFIFRLRCIAYDFLQRFSDFSTGLFHARMTNCISIDLLAEASSYN